MRVATCPPALVDPAGGTCTYVNAGHLPPALIRPAGGTLLLPGFPPDRRWAPAPAATWP
ncbi:serine/threonine-protein phosphatase [Streptomyces sp. NBC_00435]|uniref:SpoIIE family protein phosphatase n=1 Tax=Streptomyces sp. NBC_00435 TaxID=2903649 RepID=UPI002E1CBB14